MAKTKRKTRSDKFPLTLHRTGQYCKKIKGKVYYFGKDKQQALHRYLEEATLLHSGLSRECSSENDGITIKSLCNLYLDFQESRVQAGELSVRHNMDQIKSLQGFVRFLGTRRLLKETSTLDLQNYKRKLRKAYDSPHRMNLHIAIMKAMFHWAKKNDVIEKTPNLDAITKAKAIHRTRSTFTAEQIGKLLDGASLQMRAMILLGLNCGFGCTDCSELLWEHVDLEKPRVCYPRRKTGVERDLPLWPETVAALSAIPRKNERVFNTQTGKPWVRMIEGSDKDGNKKHTNNDSIGKGFSKLIKKVGIEKEKGMGFYTLRRTAATLTAASGDPFAVQRLLGHADLTMATTYVQNVSEQTDRAINNTRSLIIQGDSRLGEICACGEHSWAGQCLA